MEDLSSCQHCRFLSEPLYEMPCCSALHCEKCIFSKARCPRCMRTFDLKNCVVYQPLKKLEKILIKCKHPNCDFMTTDILIKFHEKDCKKATYNEELVDVLMKPQERPENYAKQRTINVLQQFSEFSNIVQILNKIMEVKETPCPTSDSEYFMHMLMNTDTLQGLAIKYGCSPQEIKELNKLPTDTIHERVALKIPRKNVNQTMSDVDVNDLQSRLEDRLIFMFKQKARCTKEEARYYLEETNMDFSKAFMIFAGDNEWAKDANPPFCPSIPTRRAIKNPPINKNIRYGCCSFVL